MSIKEPINDSENPKTDIHSDNPKEEIYTNNPNSEAYSNNSDDKIYTNNPDYSQYTKISVNGSFTNNPNDANLIEPDNNKLFFDGDNDKNINENLIEENINDINDNKKEIEGEIQHNNQMKLIGIANNDDQKFDQDNKLDEGDHLLLKEEDPNIFRDENRLIKGKEKGKNTNQFKNKSLTNEKNEENNSIIDSILGNDESQNPYDTNKENDSKIIKILLPIYFGQIISLLKVGSGYCKEKILVNKGILIPFLINSSYYFLLFLLYFLISCFKIRKPKRIYILISLLDILANFINVYILSVSNIEFLYIINIFNTNWSIILTITIINGYKYFINHIQGIIYFFIGGLLLLIGPFYGKSLNDYKTLFECFNLNISGLFLISFVSFLNGLKVVLVEKYISSKTYEIKSYCTWLGIFGFFISLIGSFIPKNKDGFELQILFDTRKNDIDGKVKMCWLISSLISALITSLAPFYIRKFQAIMLYVSLVFTIFWKFLIDNILIKGKEYETNWFHKLSFLGFIIMIFGTILYFWKDKVKNKDYNLS